MSLVAVLLVSQTPEAAAQTTWCMQFSTAESPRFQYQMFDSTVADDEHYGAVFFDWGDVGNHSEAYGQIVASVHEAHYETVDLGNGVSTVQGSLGLGSRVEVALPDPAGHIKAYAYSSYHIGIEVLVEDSTLHIDNYVLEGATFTSSSSTSAGVVIVGEEPLDTQLITFEADPGTTAPFGWGQQLEIDLAIGEYELHFFALSTLDGHSGLFPSDTLPLFLAADWQVNCDLPAPTPQRPVIGIRPQRIGS